MFLILKSPCNYNSCFYVFVCSIFVDEDFYDQLMDALDPDFSFECDSNSSSDMTYKYTNAQEADEIEGNNDNDDENVNMGDAGDGCAANGIEEEMIGKVFTIANNSYSNK